VDEKHVAKGVMVGASRLFPLEMWRMKTMEIIKEPVQ
jgi:hypothetical protein